MTSIDDSVSKLSNWATEDARLPPNPSSASAIGFQLLHYQITRLPNLVGSSGERQQRDIPSLLDRARKPPLMRGADSRQPPGNDLPALGDELREQTNVLVVDALDLLDAEFAN